MSRIIDLLRKHVRWGGRFRMSTVILERMIKWIFPEKTDITELMKECGDFYFEVGGTSDDFWNLMDSMRGSDEGDNKKTITATGARDQEPLCASDPVTAVVRTERAAVGPGDLDLPPG